MKNFLTYELYGGPRDGERLTFPPDFVANKALFFAPCAFAPFGLSVYSGSAVYLDPPKGPCVMYAVNPKTRHYEFKGYLNMPPRRPVEAQTCRN